jgi:hypothetical protein
MRESLYAGCGTRRSRASRRRRPGRASGHGGNPNVHDPPFVMIIDQADIGAGRNFDHHRPGRQVQGRGAIRVLELSVKPTCRGPVDAIPIALLSVTPTSPLPRKIPPLTRSDTRTGTPLPHGRDWRHRRPAVRYQPLKTPVELVLCRRARRRLNRDTHEWPLVRVLVRNVSPDPNESDRPGQRGGGERGEPEC